MNKMLQKTGVWLSALAVLTGCSTASQNITAEYISPNQYQSYDCEQLTLEATRILVRVKQLGFRLDQAANNDKAIGVVGAILFWPALFALGAPSSKRLNMPASRVNTMRSVRHRLRKNAVHPMDSPLPSLQSMWTRISRASTTLKWFLS